MGQISVKTYATTGSLLNDNQQVILIRIGWLSKDFYSAQPMPIFIKLLANWTTSLRFDADKQLLTS